MITIQFVKMKNAIINEDLVQPRIVNMQTMEFNDWCAHLADGSTVTAADVAAVMKQLETKLPLILGLNTKVVCSPDGLTFRPKVSGSITQSDLRKKLEARKAAETDPEKAAKIDVTRALTTSDLTIDDCDVSIVVDLPKMWSASFMQKAHLKRVNKATSSSTEEDGGLTPNEGEGNTEGEQNQNGGSGSNSGTSETPETNTGGQGGGSNGGGSTIDTGGNGGSTNPDDGEEG